jgi:hypothetical protein
MLKRAGTLYASHTLFKTAVNYCQEHITVHNAVTQAIARGA